MVKRFKQLMSAASASVMLVSLSFNANADATSDRIEMLEGNQMLLEEALASVRKDMEDRMRVSGYVDVEYIMQKDKDAKFRMHHLSIFFQKKISDKWKFFSEIEFEDTPKFEGKGSSSKAVDKNGNATGEKAVSAAEGKIFLEAVNLDYQIRPEAIVRFGRFFTPAGIWSVDHYPPFVPTQERPGHIRNIFPQLADGAMVYGTFNVAGHFLNYDAYYVNGEGNYGAGDANEEKAIGLKASAVLNVPMFSHLELGGTYYGDPKDTKNADSEKTALGVHAKVKMGDIAFQTEAAYAKFEGGSKTIGTKSGYYAQLIYQPAMWSVGYRYDNYDSDRSKDGETTTNTLFAGYRFNTNLVVKVEHHIIDASGTDDNKTIFSVVSYLE